MTSGDISRILDALPLPSLCIAQDGRIEAVNPPFKSLYMAAEIGRPFALVLRQPAVVAAVERCFQTGEPQRAQIDLNVGQRDVRWHMTATVLTGGTSRQVLLVFEDRTALEESAQIRRDFVANVSHELRSPLTALLGFIETLKMAARDDPAARARFLDVMEREAMRMARLVSDLLSLSRVESEERMRPTERVDLAALIESVLHLIRATAEESGVRLEAVNLDRPVVVRGDPDQLRQVFTNLVENAVKYGGSGGVVTVAIALVGHDPTLRTDAVRVDVIDRGEGFDPLHIPRLTERFYRIDNHRSREKGGTGLGLAIVKHIVNRHRGRMRIESQPGQGSRFSVFLPL